MYRNLSTIFDIDDNEISVQILFNGEVRINDFTIIDEYIFAEEMAHEFIDNSEATTIKIEDIDSYVKIYTDELKHDLIDKIIEYLELNEYDIKY